MQISLGEAARQLGLTREGLRKNLLRTTREIPGVQFNPHGWPHWRIDAAAIPALRKHLDERRSS